MIKSKLMKRQLSESSRWYTFFGTILTQFALGSVYTWSLFNSYFSMKVNASIIDVSFTFGILCLSLALASSMAGYFQERFGVRLSTLFSGVTLFLGLSLTGISDNLSMLWLCGGVVVGFADGIAYLMTLTNCIRFFPEKKGIISALSIGSYGLGALAFKFINFYLLEHYPLQLSLLVWGGICAVLCIIGGLMMMDAPKKKVSKRKDHDYKNYALSSAIRTYQYWLLFIMFFTTMMAGLYFIGVAKDIAISVAHLDVKTASEAVTIIAVTNLLGRLVMGIMSDKVKIIRVITLGQVILLFGIALLVFTDVNKYIFFVSLGCIAFNFGGHLTTFPALVADFFGINNITRNYGFIYLGFGLGSFSGSAVAYFFGGFHATLVVILCLVIISIISSVTLKHPSGMCDIKTQ